MHPQGFNVIIITSYSPNEISYLTLKSLKKSALILFILLIGYGQLILPLYPVYSPARSMKGLEYVHTLDIKKTEVVAVCVEEWEEKDEEQISFKRNSGSPSAFSFAHRQEYFLQPIKNYSFFGKHLSSFSFFRSPYLVFRVFRL